MVKTKEIRRLRQLEYGLQALIGYQSRLEQAFSLLPKENPYQPGARSGFFKLIHVHNGPPSELSRIYDDFMIAWNFNKLDTPRGSFSNKLQRIASLIHPTTNRAFEKVLSIHDGLFWKDRKIGKKARIFLIVSSWFILHTTLLLQASSEVLTLQDSRTSSRMKKGADRILKTLLPTIEASTALGDRFFSKYIGVAHLSKHFMWQFNSTEPFTKVFIETQTLWTKWEEMRGSVTWFEHISSTDPDIERANRAMRVLSKVLLGPYAFEEAKYLTEPNDLYPSFRKSMHLKEYASMKTRLFKMLPQVITKLEQTYVEREPMYRDKHLKFVGYARSIQSKDLSGSGQKTKCFDIVQGLYENFLAIWEQSSYFWDLSNHFICPVFREFCLICLWLLLQSSLMKVRGLKKEIQQKMDTVLQMTTLLSQLMNLRFEHNNDDLIPNLSVEVTLGYEVWSTLDQVSRDLPEGTCDKKSERKITETARALLLTLSSQMRREDQEEKERIERKREACFRAVRRAQGGMSHVEQRRHVSILAVN